MAEITSGVEAVRGDSAADGAHGSVGSELAIVPVVENLGIVDCLEQIPPQGAQVLEGVPPPTWEEIVQGPL